MKLIQATFLIIICAFQIVFAQNTWTQKANPPFISRTAPFGFANGQKGYMCMGYDINNQLKFDNWQYDASNDSWLQKTNLPFASKTGAVAFTVGAKSYSAFGFISSGQGTNDLWEYDNVNDTWTQKASCPGAGRGLANSFVINEKAYVTCGSLNGFNATYLNDCWEFDYQNNTWTAKAAFPGVQRVWPVSFVVDDLAFVGTGGDSLDNALNDFYSYDNQTDTWTPVSNFPDVRMGGVAFAINNTGYVGFGDNGIGKPNDLWYYEKSADTWHQAAGLPSVGRDLSYGFVINNKFYLGAGIDVQANVLGDLWEYSPDSTLGVVEAYKSSPVISIIKNETEIKIHLEKIHLPAVLSIYNLMGNEILSTRIISLESSFTEARLNEGNLIYSLTDFDGQTYSDKIKVIMN